LIECKGNQSGPAESANQFVQGRLQKTNIRFTDEQLVGQRMVTGLAIANPKSKWNTQLAVIDPPPDEIESAPHVLVRVEEPEKVTRVLKEVQCLDSLLLAGFFDRARKVAPESERVKHLAEAPDHAPAEFESNDELWQGQVYSANFPVTLKTFEGHEIAGVRMKFGVSPEFLKISGGGLTAWNDRTS